MGKDENNTDIKVESVESELIQQVKSRYTNQLKKVKGWVLLTSLLFMVYSLFLVKVNACILPEKPDLKCSIAVLELVGYILLLVIWAHNQDKIAEYKDIKESWFIRDILIGNENKYNVKVVKNAKIVKVLGERVVRAGTSEGYNGIFTIEKHRKKVGDTLDYIVFMTPYAQMAIEIKERSKT